MRMLTFLTFLFVQSGFSCPPVFQDTFPSKYQAAVEIVSEQYSRWASIANELGEDPSFCISLVFPEIVRYCALKDSAECSFLSVLYTRFGSNASDFSVGLFQMKPSFLEFIDTSVSSHNSTNPYLHLVSYPMNLSTSDIRRVRIDRIRCSDWQMIYLCLFVKIVREKTSQISFFSEPYKLKFYSASYNIGSSFSIQNARDAIAVRYYPFGKYHIGKQYSYSDISLDCYNNFSCLWPQLRVTAAN